MNHLTEIEDDIKNIGNEAKNKYPLVKEAADRGLAALKIIRTAYVSDIMKKSKDETEKTVKFPQSSDVLAPYMLACNYADGSNKLITMALNGIHKLLEFHMVPPGDVQNILRVLSIQASSSKFDMQLKLLQILIKMADSLSRDDESSQYLTENTICSFLTLSLQICDGRSNVSVSTTALGTVRQLIALVMDGTLNLFLKGQEQHIHAVNSSGSSSHSHNLKRASSGSAQMFVVNAEQASSSFSISAIMLIREMCLFIQGLSGEWIRGTSIPQSFALDLMYEILTGWKFLFIHVPNYKALLHDCICPALKPLLKCLQDDYLICAARNGVTVAAAFTSRVVRIARCFVMNFVCPELYGDCEFILTLLVHALQPGRGGESSAQIIGSEASRRGATPRQSGSSSSSSSSASQPPEDPTFRTRFEEASQIIPGAGALISRLAGPMSIAAGAINNLQKTVGGVGGGSGNGTPGGGLGSGPGGAQALSKPNLSTLSTIPNFYLNLVAGNSAPLSSNPLMAGGGGASINAAAANASIQMPSHPAAVCLEAILSFLLCCEQFHQTRSEAALHLLETLLVSVTVSVSGLLNSALAVDMNVRDLDVSLRRSNLKVILKGIMSGEHSVSTDGVKAKNHPETVAKALNEYIIASPGVKPCDVLQLCFTLLLVVPRLLLKAALQLNLYTNSTAAEIQQKQINGSAFLSTGLKSMLPLYKEDLPSFFEVAPKIRVTVARVTEYVYESTLDACFALLNTLENAYVIRASLGVVAEMAITAGSLGLSKPCEIIVSVLCRYMVPMWHGQEMLHQMQGFESAASPGASAKDKGGDGGAPSIQYPDALQWRHVQAIVRLFQVVHIIADVISDWDSIVDAFEQLVSYLSTTEFKSNVIGAAAAASGTTSSTGKSEMTTLEIDKIFSVIERFKVYSVFLSDDALVKLMTSLVALSMNNLAVNATSMFGAASAHSHGEKAAAGGGGAQLPTAGGNPAHIEPAGGVTVNQFRSKWTTGPSYIVSGVSAGSISFSLQAVIEITKLNSFRISTVWQMVTSHLRMIASLKSAKSRAISVAATHDVILTSLKYLQNTTSPISNLTFLKEEPFSPGPTTAAAAAQTLDSLLTDDMVFNQILPSFESVFVARDFHRNLSIARNQVLLYNPKLSQSDLLSSLRALSNVRYGDVRNDILTGLSNMLQSRGQSIDVGGWLVIVDIIGSVPASMSTESFLAECYSEDRGSDDDDEDDGTSAAPPSERNSESAADQQQQQQHQQRDGSSHLLVVANPTSSSLPLYQWPRESLPIAFNCMTLIVEEFLDIVIAQTDIVKSILQCLSVFTSQLKDVNISLTSVEMLWKVTDNAIKAFRSQDVTVDKQYVESVFDSMLKKLFLLSIDSRPEIRNCAINTLFSAMAAHAPIISASQWKQVFESIVFPLFSRTDARSKQAVSNNEEAMAPELKKGVKMNVHHSRDTAHKQWSETRVLALRGLTRVMRTCAKILLEEAWFQEVWIDSITVCHEALQSACEDQEVSIAGLDVIVSMLRIIISMESAPASAAEPAGKTLHSKGSFTKQQTTTTVPHHQHHHVTESIQVQEEKARLSKIGINESSVSANQQQTLLSEKTTRIEKCKQHLWSLAWNALHSTAFFSCPSVELSYAIVQRLADLYKSRADHEFRYSDNIRVLLEMLVTLVRPRIVFTNAGVVDAVSAKQDRVAESQLQRGVMDLIREIVPKDLPVITLLLSTLSEICFAFQWVQVTSPMTGEMLILGAAPEKLRVDAGELLVQIQTAFTKLAESGDSKPPAPEKGKFNLVFSPQYAPVMLDIVTRRFLCDICEVPLINRSESVKALAAFSSASSTAAGAITPIKSPKTGDSSSGRRPSVSSELEAHRVVPSAAAAAAAAAPAVSSHDSPSASGGSSAGFFTSLANMISPVNTSSSALPAPSLKTSTGASSSNFTLHKFSRYIPAPDSMQSQRLVTMKFTKSSSAISASSTSKAPSSSNTPVTPGAASPSTSSATASMMSEKWRSFFCLGIEAQVLDSALNGFLLTSKHGSEVPTELMWWNTLSCLACLMSPWRRSEIAQYMREEGETETEANKAVEMFNALSLITLKLLDTLVKFTSNPRFPAHYTMAFITSLTQSTLLGVYSIASNDTSDAALESFSSYLLLWVKVRDILCSVVESSVHYYDIDTRKCALNRLLFAAKEMCGIINSRTGVTLPSEVYSVCCEFLSGLVDLNVPLLFLQYSEAEGAYPLNASDSNSSDDGSVVVDDLEIRLSYWLGACVSSKSHEEGSSHGERFTAAGASSAGASAAATPAANKKQASVQFSAESGSSMDLSDNKSHLMLLMAVAVQLIINCRHPKLKEVAAQVVGYTDMQRLINTLTRLTSRNQELEQENRELKNEIVSVRSAASLPF